MDEYQFAEGPVARMRSLVNLAGNHEVVRRTILSRVYYSVHHLSRYLLRNVGIRPETWRRNVHRRVIDEMRRRFVIPNLIDTEVLQFLENMRRYRVRADYQLHLAVAEWHVENMFTMFDDYFAECRRSILRKIFVNPVIERFCEIACAEASNAQTLMNTGFSFWI